MSKTYISTIVLFINAVAPILGFQINENDLVFVLNVVATIVSAFYILYKRYQEGGVSAFGVKR